MHRQTFLFVLVLGLFGVVPTAQAGGHAFEQVDGSVAKVRGGVEAGPQGATLKLGDGAVLRLEAGARISRSYRTHELWLDVNGRTPTHIVSVREGYVEVSVPATPGSHAVLLSTPLKLSAAAREGQLAVSVARREAAVANLSGKAVVSTGAAWKPLAEGAIWSTARAPGAASVQKRQSRVIAAPRLSVPARIWLARAGGVDIDVAPIPIMTGAERYVVMLEQEDSVAAAPRKLTSSSGDFQRAFSNVEPGVYRISAWVVDRFGFPSERSRVVRVNVVGVEVPDGSYVPRAGAIQLSAGHSVRLTHARGLLMTYGAAKRWLPAPGKVGLYRNADTLVHFRHPDQKRAVSLRLEPRSIRAQVEMTPRLAVWPRDPVRIAVVVKSDRRPDVLRGIEPKVEVRLGLAPLELKWEKDDGVLRTEVPPQPGRGPWVLRVRVTDQHGIELGRDFLEVAHVAPKPAPRKADRTARR